MAGNPYYVPRFEEYYDEHTLPSPVPTITGRTYHEYVAPAISTAAYLVHKPLSAVYPFAEAAVTAHALHRGLLIPGEKAAAREAKEAEERQRDDAKNERQRRKEERDVTRLNIERRMMKLAPQKVASERAAAAAAENLSESIRNSPRGAPPRASKKQSKGTKSTAAKIASKTIPRAGPSPTVDSAPSSDAEPPSSSGKKPGPTGFKVPYIPPRRSKQPSVAPPIPPPQEPYVDLFGSPINPVGVPEPENAARPRLHGGPRRPRTRGGPLRIEWANRVVPIQPRRAFEMWRDVVPPPVMPAVRLGPSRVIRHRVTNPVMHETAHAHLAHVPEPQVVAPPGLGAVIVPETLNLVFPRGYTGWTQKLKPVDIEQMDADAERALAIHRRTGSIPETRRQLEYIPGMSPSIVEAFAPGGMRRLLDYKSYIPSALNAILPPNYVGRIRQHALTISDLRKMSHPSVPRGEEL